WSLPGSHPVRCVRYEGSTVGSGSAPSLTHCTDRLLGQRDGIDVAPVVALTAVGRAPIAEEPLRIRVRAMAKVLDAEDAGSAQARRDVAREIEQGVRRGC